MQFIKNGPDIPERLLQAHEDGKVVFFCGAGISFPAKCPGFKGLVNKLYDCLHEQPNKIEQSAMKAGLFDTAIGSLESRISGGREIVRSHLPDALTPDLTATNATATHEALLTLSKNREEKTRLITTNFDRLFEEVIARKTLSVNRFEAPLLPIPKNRWGGLVYLHGLLSEAPQPHTLDNLIISSGDFGLAYLTERWAARFVSELFRTYTVCFIGYSLNDPIIRYMMDALAADRMHGETLSEMYAFGSFSKGKEDEYANEWRAKNVTPILYRAHRRHFHMQKTLQKWATTYRDGALGKEQIVSELAIARPLVSTKEDNFIGRMLWALRDPTGLPAKRFAEFDPVPSLDWLEEFDTDYYDHDDLDKFDIAPNEKLDKKIKKEFKFSLICRPTPYNLAPQMTLSGMRNPISKWDKVMENLANWLIRHLDDPKLLLWLVKQGGHLDSQLVNLIEIRLDRLAELKRRGDNAELKHIRNNAAKAIPGPLMRTLWQLLLTGRVRAPTNRFDNDIDSWSNKFKRDGFSASLKIELREMLTPRVNISNLPPWREKGSSSTEPKKISDLVDWEVVLSSDDVHSNIMEISQNEDWNDALPELLRDFTLLLRDALDLTRDLGGANEKSDRSYWIQSSISEHEQNRINDDWSVLIKLARDAWLATKKQSIDRARLETDIWWDIPYPLFRRLSFFAAAQDGVIPDDKAFQWLLSDENFWLWSGETKREAIRLLVKLVPTLNLPMLEKLVKAIVNGPPSIQNDVDPERQQASEDHRIWLRLAKILETGVTLPDIGKDKFRELSTQYPDWVLKEDQRDEFSLWMESGGWEDEPIQTPRRRIDLIEWLKEPADPWHSDDWQQRCRDNFSTAACALCSLSHENIWPVDKWQVALKTWSDGKTTERSWRYMAQVVSRIPNEKMKELAHSISWWLKGLSKSLHGQENLFLVLVNRILDLDDEEGIESDDIVFSAMNHPIGLVTQTLLNWWHRGTLEDNKGLPNEIQEVFSKIADTNEDKYRYGRILLAENIITLFRVSPDWSKQILLPLFDWNASEIEARSAWGGFLLSPRLYRPLMNEMKSDFLNTAQHYNSLGMYGEQYASLITFVALDALEINDVFTKAELRTAIHALPVVGLSQSAKALLRGMQNAGKQRAEYWKNRLKPFLREIWPKTKNFESSSIAKTFGFLCVESGDDFSDVFQKVKPWLKPQEHPSYLVQKLHDPDAKLCSKFPGTSLEFLNLVIGGRVGWLPRELGECLNQIKNADQSLERDEKYMRLLTLVKQHD